jgi:hypothetical protein
MTGWFFFFMLYFDDRLHYSLVNNANYLIEMGGVLVRASSQFRLFRWAATGSERRAKSEPLVGINATIVKDPIIPERQGSPCSGLAKRCGLWE